MDVKIGLERKEEMGKTVIKIGRHREKKRMKNMKEEMRKR